MFGLNRKNFAIMDATVGDHASIADLHGLNFARGWTTSEIDKLAEQSNTFVLVARTVGEPDAPVLGFNIVRHTPQEAEILSIAVDRRGRRRGLGDALMREAILRLRADRISNLLLEVDIENEAAIKLYEKLGFETIAQRPGYYDKKDENGLRAHTSALVMSLSLG